MDKNVIGDIPLQILQFYSLFINRYNNRFLPLLWQLFLIPNRINMFVDLKTSTHGDSYFPTAISI